MTSYQPNIPTGNVPLNQDYLNVQANFQQLNTTYSTDHIAFTVVANNGYHTVVHMVSNSTIASNPPNNYPITPPPAIGLTGELFTTQSNDGVNPDEILWYQSGGGRLMQLTRNFVPVASANGSTFLPGGLILQWGTLTTTGILTTVSFNFSFPANCFIVLTEPNVAAVNGNQQFSVSSKSTTGFSFGTNTGYSVGSNFFWAAIGN